MGPTDILREFQNYFITGQIHLQHPAMALLATVSLITVTWSMLMATLDESGAVLKELIRKVIFIGFFIWFVRSWSWLIQKVIGGFIWAGTTAGGSGNFDVMKDPSAVLKAGFTTIKTIALALAQSDPLSLSDLSTVIMFILIVICYGIITTQIFLVQIEFGIVATLGLILIPFGVLKPMAFISERVFGAIISFGVKIMVLAFLMSIIMPILLKLSLPAEPNFFTSTNLLMVVAMLAFLAWHAPNVAASLLSGSPNLSAQSAGGAAASTVKTAVTVAKAVKTAGASLAKAKG